jgi:hypothetical protein
MLEIYEEPSPLIYDRSGNVRRFAVWSPELVNVPFLPNDTYFAEIQKKTKYGKNGKLLKEPKIKIIQGARSGTVGWIDWHAYPNGVYIDFMNIREDWRKSGFGQKLVEVFYEKVIVGKESVHWGRIVSPYAWKIYQKMKSKYPQIYHSGHVDF